MEEQNVAIRLKGFIDSLGLSYSQFADECGIPRPSLSQLINGRNKKISDVLIGLIHKAYPSLSVVWLLFGEGPMVTTSASSSLSIPSNCGDEKTIGSGEGNEIYSNSPLLKSDENLTNSEIPSDYRNGQNVGALNIPVKDSQEIDNRIIEFEFKIADLQRQIEKLKNSPRKVSQITVYYDDSTFETFFPRLDTNKC